MADKDSKPAQQQPKTPHSTSVPESKVQDQIENRDLDSKGEPTNEQIGQPIDAQVNPNP